MPVIIILILVVVSGGVAAAGDYMGQRAARRKLRIGKLRPRYVSRLIAVVSGILISLVTYGAMFLLYRDFREALTQYDSVKAKYVQATQDRDKVEQELQGAQDKVKAANTQVDTANAAVKDLQASQIKLVEDNDAERKAGEALKATNSTLTAQVADKQRQVSSLDAQLAQSKKLLAQAKHDISTVRGQSVASSIRLDKLRHGTILMDEGTPLARVQVDAADVAQRESKLRGALQSAQAILADQLQLTTDSGAEGELEGFIKNYPYANPPADAVVEIVTAANVVEGDPVPIRFRARPIKPLVGAGELLLTLRISDNGMRIEPRGRKALVVKFKADLTPAELENALNTAGAEYDQAMEDLGFIAPAGMSPQELAHAVGEVSALGDQLLTHDRPYVIQVASKRELKSTDWPFEVTLNVFTEPGH